MEKDESANAGFEEDQLNSFAENGHVSTISGRGHDGGEIRG